MNIIIVDDEPLALEKLKEQIEPLQFVHHVYAFNNPFHSLELLQKQQMDVAILDIEMFGINGIELAKQYKLVQPSIKIIFLTGYSHYAVSAFQIRANGYLLKPASTEEICDELLYVTQIQPSIPSAKIRIQTFGNFEVFVNEKPMTFERSKAKELLAYLVIRKGAYVNGDELLAILFEDKPITASSKSQLRNLIASLTKSLKQAGCADLLLKRRNQLAIDTTSCSCDYYSFLEGDISAINSFMGEFMNNYDWAEFITGYLEKTQDAHH